MPYVIWQVLNKNFAGRTGLERRALESLIQFVEVAGPGVELECRQRLIVEAVCASLLKEMLR